MTMHYKSTLKENLNMCVTLRTLVPIALIGDSHVMGWGSKAIEIRAVDNGQLDGVFMHKRIQKLRFLCERNDKVRLAVVLYMVAICLLG